ncbi:MAG: hypothetical protein KBF88_09900 [Polyangiaceae bacterium]|nr:hypothetical protein [Polyangiaceae bacterium]
MKSGLLVGLALLLAFASDQVKGPLASVAHTVKQDGDASLLPPPDELKTLTFGYRAATVDYLWGKLLVEHGTHNHEKREFPDLERYLDAIVALEPDLHFFYKFVDTLLCFRPIRGYEKDVRKARWYFEQHGLKARPYDHQLWLHYGEFLAFGAPSFLREANATDVDEWKRTGANAIFRAIELGADPDRSISAATILGKSGERQGLIRQLERALAHTDEPETRADLLARLEHYQVADVRDRADKRLQRIQSRWRSEMPFLDRNEYLLLGPIHEPLSCVGLDAMTRTDCRTHWTEFLGDEKP